MLNIVAIYIRRASRAGVIDKYTLVSKSLWQLIYQGHAAIENMNTGVFPGRKPVAWRQSARRDIPREKWSWIQKNFVKTHDRAFCRHRIFILGACP
jgi:hypothetical protein